MSELSNVTTCLICKKKFYGHLTGNCLACRKKDCADCGKKYEPNPIGRKVCARCWRKRMRE